MSKENTEQTTTIPVALSAETWKVIGFLVRRGAVGEYEQQLAGTGVRHEAECLTGFLEAYKALAAQLPDVLPQVTPAEMKAENT